MPPEYPVKSPIQLEQRQAGGWGLAGMPDAVMEMVEDDEPVRDWLAELGLPKDWDALERLAQPQGLSARRFRCIVADESPTTFPGGFRLQPAKIWWRDRLLLTLAHLGFFVGAVEWIYHGLPRAALADQDLMGVLRPGAKLFLEPDEPEPEGLFIVAQMCLYDSKLADAAWVGIRRGVFGHVCAVLMRVPATAEPGTGELVEIAIGDRPGCPGARILRFWET